jgi:uncharacterized membrane protein
MLAKNVVKAFGYKWDDNWVDSDNVNVIVDTMLSLDETLADILNVIEKIKGE